VLLLGRLRFSLGALFFAPKFGFCGWDMFEIASPRPLAELRDFVWAQIKAPCDGGGG
jgi:hypothetical protein